MKIKMSFNTDCFQNTVIAIRSTTPRLLLLLNILKFTPLNIIFGGGANFPREYFILDLLAHEQENVGNIFILLCTDLEKLNPKSFR